MLAERLELHAPQCRAAGTGLPCDCHPILDLEAFVGAVVAAHFGAGTKRQNGTLTGSPWLSPEDREDVRQYLLGEAWIASRKFDGRGRLTGFVLAQLHFRATDW